MVPSRNESVSCSCSGFTRFTQPDMLFDLISSFRLFNRSQFMRALLFDAQKKKRKRKYPVYINSLLGLFRLFPMFLCLKKFSKTVPSPSERNNREKGEWSEKDEQSIERNEVTPRINYSKWTSVVDGGSIKSRKLLEGRWKWRGGLTSRLRRLCFQRLSIRRIDDKTRASVLLYPSPISSVQSQPIYVYV